MSNKIVNIFSGNGLKVAAFLACGTWLLCAGHPCAGAWLLVIAIVLAL